MWCMSGWIVLLPNLEPGFVCLSCLEAPLDPEIMQIVAGEESDRQLAGLIGGAFPEWAVNTWLSFLAPRKLTCL